jgi:hypothetical protein
MVQYQLNFLSFNVKLTEISAFYPHPNPLPKGRGDKSKWIPACAKMTEYLA